MTIVLASSSLRRRSLHARLFNFAPHHANPRSSRFLSFCAHRRFSSFGFSLSFACALSLSFACALSLFRVRALSLSLTNKLHFDSHLFVRWANQARNQLDRVGLAGRVCSVSTKHGFFVLLVSLNLVSLKKKGINNRT